MKLFGINFGTTTEQINEVENVSKNVLPRTKVINKIVERELSRSAQNVKKWRNATITAESKLNPNRLSLLEIYKDVVLDAHLSSLMETIKLKVTAGDFYLCDNKGEHNDEMSALLNRSWFTFYLEKFVESTFYGHSLIQLGGIKENEFIDFELVPREHVVPEFGIVKTNPWSYATDGTGFRDTPFNDWLIEIGDKTDLGLLLKASPLVLWKKGIFGSWSQFSELFGMPMRVGKTDILNPENKKNMENMLSGMSSASYAVLNTDDVLELVERSQSDSYQVFDAFINRLNSEMSKLILGQTGTTDEKSFVGSAEIHNDILTTYITAIKSKIENHLNKNVIPLMYRHGMITAPGLRFKWDNDESVDLAKKFEFTKELLKSYTIPAEWINETFNIPVEDMALTESNSVIPGVKNLYDGIK